MLDVSHAEYPAFVDDLTEVLCSATNRDAPSFFHTLVAYYACTASACLRAEVMSPALGLGQPIPINCFAIALAPSGFGKGKATGKMENAILADFRATFRDYMMPQLAEANISRLASTISAATGLSDDKIEATLKKEFEECGTYPFVFDGGSESAIKQVRTMLQLANCGSLNLQIDEIGMNLEKTGTSEALATYFELYDVGQIKDKLLKNTSENKRRKQIEGPTPANMLLFGTPTMLLDSGPTERKFYALLQAGLARRATFAWADNFQVLEDSDDENVIYDRLTNPLNLAAIDQWSAHFASLADPAKLGWTVQVPEAVDKLFLRYMLDCKHRANALSMFEDIRRTELEHRHFRALKIAGAFAFVDESLTMTEEHALAAMRLLEESGEAFDKLLAQDPAHVKLARYFASDPGEVTHAELFQQLPFFKAANKGERGDMLTMASAWGYKQHVIIRRRYADGIELLSGETLKPVDLDNLAFSASNDFTHQYESYEAPWDELHRLPEAGSQWTTHTYRDGYRHQDNVIPGFHLAVFDVDGGATLDQVHDLLEGYTFLTTTTKRHGQNGVDRFRLIMPLSHHLAFERDDYTQFMGNLCAWLPFEVDVKASCDQSRKWATNAKHSYRYSAGDQLVDVLPFIPRTSRNEEHQKRMKELGSLDALERWFAERFQDGQRNDMMIRFALALVNGGFTYQEIEDRVLDFNKKLEHGLSAAELKTTVLKTVGKRLANAP